MAHLLAAREAFRDPEAGAAGADGAPAIAEAHRQNRPSKRDASTAWDRASGEGSKRSKTPAPSCGDSGLSNASLARLPADWARRRAATPAGAAAPADLSCAEPCPSAGGSEESDVTRARSRSPSQASSAPVGAPTPAGAPPPPVAPPPVDSALAAMLRALAASEPATAPDPRYLERAQASTGLDAAMRGAVVSWMVEVAAEFRLGQEALHLAASLLDRFLSTARGVPRARLQLAAVAALLVAAKHEEEAHPAVAEFVRIADDSFSAEDLLRMEGALLSALGFRANAPTAATFLALIRGALRLTDEAHALASYLAELALLDYSLLALPASAVAAGAAALAAARLGDGAALRALPGLVPTAAASAVTVMLRLQALQRAADAAARRPGHALSAPVREKFAGREWHAVALLPPLERLAAPLPPRAPAAS